MASLPLGTSNAFTRYLKTCPNENKIVIDRLSRANHQRFTKVLNKIDEIFGKFNEVNLVTHEPIYDEPVFSQWVVLINVFSTFEDLINQDKAAKYSEGIKHYHETLQNIHETAKKLANLLRSAEVQRNQYSCSTDYTVSIDQLVFDTIDNTADVRKKCLFESEIKPIFEKLSRFDDRYWPTLEEVCDELTRQTRIAETKPWLSLPNQIHKKNAFLSVFFERIKFLIDRHLISHELLSLTNEDWCWFLNTASGTESFFHYDIGNFKRNNKQLF